MARGSLSVQLQKCPTLRAFHFCLCDSSIEPSVLHDFIMRLIQLHGIQLHCALVTSGERDSPRFTEVSSLAAIYEFYDLPV